MASAKKTVQVMRNIFFIVSLFYLYERKEDHPLYFIQLVLSNKKLSNNNLHIAPIESSSDSIRSMNNNIGNIEALITTQLTELLLLLR